MRWTRAVKKMPGSGSQRTSVLETTAPETSASKWRFSAYSAFAVAVLRAEGEAVLEAGQVVVVRQKTDAAFLLGQGRVLPLRLLHGRVGARIGRGEFRMRGLERGDVGADAHPTAVGGLALADHEPAPVGQQALERSARLLAPV